MDAELLDSMWAQVLPLLNKIFEDNISHTELWTAYNCVTAYLARPPDVQNDNPANTRSGTVGSRGWLVYLKLKDFLTSVCKNLSEKCAGLVDEDLLQHYNTEWKKYVSTNERLSFVFRYLNDYYITNHREYGEDPEICYYVNVLSIIVWKETIFEEYNGKIIKAANELLNRERQGEKIDSALIVNLVSCCSKLGIHADGINGSRCVYENYFEKSFLEETETFYVKKSTALLEGESTFTMYLEWVNKRLLEESLMVSRYLHSSTDKLITKVLKSSLIGSHLQSFYTSFEDMLISEDSGIELLYSIASEHVEDLREFVDIFQKHVSDRGLSSIKERSEAVVKNPKIFVDAIMEVYKKYMGMIDLKFCGNTAFKSAVQIGTVSFVNRNALTMPPNTSRKTSQLVTKYCDELLRSRDPNKKTQLDEIMTIFRFIEDKDVFQDYHKKLLAKRLVNGTSNDEEFESYMILKMKEINGAHSVAKLERMVKDIQLSKDINVTFAQHNQESLDVDFNIMVLQSCSWSFLTSPRHNLPLELEKCVTQFSKFYSEAHSGKKLIWLYNLSKGEIITNHLKTRYTIQASTRQISILVLFNSSDSWTVKQIQEQTNIDLDMVLQIIQILLKAKFLTSESAEDLTADSTVCLNRVYNNKKHHININVPLKTETHKEEVAAEKNIDQERMYVIQATIVRIMKSQKSINHNELISKVLEDLASQFKPTIVVIKRNIQALIEKDYIKRSPTGPNTYDYVA